MALYQQLSKLSVGTTSTSSAALAKLARAAAAAGDQDAVAVLQKQLPAAYTSLGQNLDVDALEDSARTVTSSRRREELLRKREAEEAQEEDQPKVRAVERMSCCQLRVSALCTCLHTHVLSAAQQLMKQLQKVNPSRSKQDNPYRYQEVCMAVCRTSMRDSALRQFDNNKNRTLPAAQEEQEEEEAALPQGL